MSMIGNYRRVTELELSGICANSECISEYLYSEASRRDENRSLDIDKSWHAIHFLLNDSPWDGSYPLVCVVLGGECIGDQDVGYGPARFLTSQQVKDIANAISRISASELLQEYSARQLNEQEIYPHGWSDTPEERDYIRGYYSSLVTFFRTAADANDAMIVYLN